MSVFSMYLLALAAGVGFVVLVVMGIVQRRLSLGLWGVGAFALAVFLVVYATFTGAQRIATKAKRMTETRSGESIYTEVFGQPARPCVTVTDHRNRNLSFADRQPMCLRMQLCPTELERILHRDLYAGERVASTDAARPIGGLDSAAVFGPEALGDTILVYQWEDGSIDHWRWIYCNLDSTEAILVDVLQ